MPFMLRRSPGLLGAAGSAGPINPATYSPMLWLDSSDTLSLFQERTGAAATTLADATDDPVGTWKDKSGNARHVTAAGDTARPLTVLNHQNGLAAVKFDGTNDFLSVTMQISTPFTIFLVAANTVYNKAYFGAGAAASTRQQLNCKSSSNAGEFFGLWNDDLSVTGLSALAGYRYLTYRLQSDLVRYIRRQGATVVTNSAGGSTNFGSGFYVGCRSNGFDFHNGHIAELVVYGDALLDAEVESVEAYLAEKWGL